MNTLMALIVFLLVFAVDGIGQTATISLVEEDREFWNDILRDEGIKNKNLLYASYVAYKDRLNDLSLETFGECIRNNPENDTVRCLALYYIGKNLFAMGQFPKALERLRAASELKCSRIEDIRYAIRINTAITHHRMGNQREFSAILTEIVNDERAGRYRSIARGVLTLVR